MGDQPIRKQAGDGATTPPPGDGSDWWRTLPGDLRASLIFLTRIPIKTESGAEAFDYRRASALFPVAGALVGLAGSALFVILATIGTPIWIASCLAIAMTIALTGGLHEDGLADTLDGLGGGRTRERKLEIMRDSRIGTHGALALILSVAIRIAALASLAAVSIWAAAAALIAAESVSRTAMVRVWHDLPPARADGLARHMGPPTPEASMAAVAIGVVIAALMLGLVLGIVPALAGILLATITTYILQKWTNAQIGGQTGDTLGAIQQGAALAVLIGAATAY